MTVVLNSEYSHSGQGYCCLPWWLMSQLNFCKPVVYFSPQLRTVSHSLLPADVLCHFSNKGGLLHTLTELCICLSFFLIFSFIPLCSTTSPLKILSVYLVIIFSSCSSHSFTRNERNLKDSLTCTLRPRPSLPIICLRKPRFLSKTLKCWYLQCCECCHVGEVFGPLQDSFHQLWPEKLATRGPQSESDYPGEKKPKQYFRNGRRVSMLS